MIFDNFTETFSFYWFHISTHEWDLHFSILNICSVNHSHLLVDFSYNHGVNTEQKYPFRFVMWLNLSFGWSVIFILTRSYIHWRSIFTGFFTLLRKSFILCYECAPCSLSLSVVCVCFVRALKENSLEA